MNKKPRLVQISQPKACHRQDTLTLLERTLRPTMPDRKLAKRIKQRLTAEWLARHLITVLFICIACVGLLFGTLRGSR
jgi:hypothetical protein